MVDYSETIEVYGIKVDIHCKLNEYREIYMYRTSRSFSDLCQRSLIFQQFQTSFSQKQSDRLKSIYILSLHETSRPKFIETGEVTLPRCPPCPYMVSTFKNLLLQNRTAGDFELLQMMILG